MSDKVLIDKQYKPVYVVQVNRPEVRNAVDGETARLLHSAFVDFAEDDQVRS
jgi:enoyl-CoA hydratase